MLWVIPCSSHVALLKLTFPSNPPFNFKNVDHLSVFSNFQKVSSQIIDEMEKNKDEKERTEKKKVMNKKVEILEY